jgi:starvation-inducible outer membrane lipoprotein
MHVNADGTLIIAGVACTNGVYVGPTNWGSLVATLKTAPTTVTRYEVAIGGWEDDSYVNIESLINSQGTGPGSILYRNFQALKKAVLGIDAINDDDELNYDLNSSTSFANMLGKLGFKFTMVPYQNQSFWVDLKNNVTNCDYIYLQCYEGGDGNDPGEWDSAFGNGTVVIPGQESNTATTTNWHNWFLETGVQGGFYYPDVVFDTAYWSAAIIEGNGAVPPAPMGLTAAPGSGQVSLSWNFVPGAISYNVKRSTISGAETNVFSLSTTTNEWPASNQHPDTGVTNNTTYFYEVSAVNDNGESLDSGEVSATPRASSVVNPGFEIPSIGSDAYRYNPTGATWTFTGASPNGSGLIANGSAFSNPNALQGVQAAFVQEDGTIKQTISGFVPGTSYTITFLAAERPGDAQTWNVTVNGAVIASYNPGSSANAYVEYSATFTATATSETVAFVGTDLAGGDNTIFIDDVQIVMSSLSASPELTTNTLPASAADVAGSQVNFTAAFSAPGPMTYQWQRISGGIVYNIPGATNTVLTLSDLQLTNTASYRLQASNAVGTATSGQSSLTVSSLPAAVNNVVAAYAAQTGYGSIATNFVPTWQVAPGSLIAGQSPSSVGGGNFSLYYAGVVPVLTDGAFGRLNYWPGVGSSPTEVTCGTVASGAGQSVTYKLAGSASGYDLTNIVVYGGWGDAGRDQQAYTVYYSTIAAPTTFIALGSVNYLPANPSAVQCATRATLAPANGVLAANVAAVKFDFTTPTGENGYEGYSEIDVFGATASAALVTQMGNGLLTLTWPADRTGWHLQVQTNNMNQGLGTNWVDVAGSTITNQISIPIDSANGNVFYRLTYP